MQSSWSNESLVFRFHCTLSPQLRTHNFALASGHTLQAIVHAASRAVVQAGMFASHPQKVGLTAIYLFIYSCWMMQDGDLSTRPGAVQFTLSVCSPSLMRLISIASKATSQLHVLHLVCIASTIHKKPQKTFKQAVPVHRATSQRRLAQSRYSLLPGRVSTTTCA